MRKLLLNTTPLFRKLRQLSMLLSLLLAFPLSVFGKGYRTTGNVIDVTGNNAGTLFTWETDATQTTVWRWQIACEASIITPNISTLTFTLPVGKNITLSINGYANDMSTVDSQSLRKLILDGISENLDVSVYLENSEAPGTHYFSRSGNVFTTANWTGTQSMSTDGRLYITITNNQADPISGTINSITLLTGMKISSTDLVWPADSPISELTKSVSNNVTTLSGNLNVDDTFSFPLKIDNGNTLSNLDSNYDIAYSSSNTNVAEVSGGYVTIKGYGSTTITATLTENDYYSYEQSTYSYTLTNTESYGLTIAGTAVTSANASAITGSGISGTVSFDATNKILTLNGATIEGTIESSLAILSIHLTGNNSIRGNTTALLNGIKSTNGGTLTFTADASSTLHITTTGDAASAITEFANVTMGTGAYLQTDIPTKYDTNGKNFCRQVSSANIVKELVITSAPCYPLWIGNTQFTSTSTPTGFSFDATNNILTLTNVTQANPLISGLANLTIALSGDNSIIKSDSSAVIRSINSQAALIIQKAGTGDGSLYLENNGSDPSASPVVKNFASINHTGLNYSSRSGSSINGASTHDAILSSATIYPLWIAGIPVTASTTSGTGWSYDAANNKLTLTNYNKTDNEGHAFISNMANLNVYLVGNNSVGPNSQTSTDKAFYTTYTNATLTFSTDENNKGTLSASGYNTFCEGFRTVNGIYCNNGLGYYPSTCKIEAKYTPTMHFAKWDETAQDYTGGNVVASETLETTYGVAFKAPRPEYDNHYQLFADSTRYTYSYAPEGIVEIPLTATDPSTGKNTFGEMNILKTGTVIITCTYPGNMQNEACSASYTLKVNKGNATFEYQVGTTAVTTSDGYIDVNGVGQWGDPNTGGGSAPALTIPSGATAITYTSSDTNVATVTTTGTVTPVGRGQTTITATMKDDDCYNNATASYVLTVKVPATISFANATASVLNTATSYTQAATTDPAGATITYSSSNNDVNVDANGQVTISNQSFYGPVTITATLTAVPDATPQLYYVLANQPAFQATYTLNVAKNFDISSIFTDASMNYATCILSEQLTKPDGLKVYYITGTNGNTVTTQEIDYLPYGIPILLEKTAATIGSVTARTDSSSVVSGNLLQYATSNVSATGNQYILYKNEFVKATGTIPSGKCYLQISTNLPARGVLGIGNDGSTAIEGIDVEATEDETWYDLQGRRIQKPTKAGIYIVNGKKMIINNK